MGLDPASLIIGGISLVSGIASGLGEQAAAEAQAEAMRTRQEQYNKQVHDEAIRQYQQLDAAEADINTDAHAESLQTQKDYLKARSTVELQAAASGTYGQSVDLIIEDLQTGKAQRMADTVLRRDRLLDDVNTTAKDISANAARQFDNTPIAEPSTFNSVMTGVQTAESVYSFADDLNSSLTASATADVGGKTAPARGSTAGPAGAGNAEAASGAKMKPTSLFDYIGAGFL